MTILGHHRFFHDFECLSIVLGHGRLGVVLEIVEFEVAESFELLIKDFVGLNEIRRRNLRSVPA